MRMSNELAQIMIRGLAATQLHASTARLDDFLLASTWFNNRN